MLAASGFACWASAVEEKTPEAILVVVADQHSAYERAAQLVARIDRLCAENPGVPLAILVNGDAFEYGNAVARRLPGLPTTPVFQLCTKLRSFRYPRKQSKTPGGKNV